MKMIRKALSVLMLVCIMLTLTGCGHDIVGEWKLTGGNAVQAVGSIDGAAQLVTSEAKAVFIFTKDGELTIDMERDGIESSVSGTWTEDDDFVLISLEGASVKCSYAVNGNELTLFFTLEGQNATLVFTGK